MIKYTGDNVNPSKDIKQDSYIYNQYTLPYSIEDKYNISADRNDIRLEVQYGGITLTASTNFTFVKTGQNGTNGTDFVCKVQPDGKVKPYYSTLYLKSNGTKNGTNWMNYYLNGKLYNSGVQVVSEQIYYYILETGHEGNRLGGNGLTVDQQYGQIDFNAQNLVYDPSNPAVDIIKVKIIYGGKNYFATLPIVISKSLNNNYQIDVKPYTGFKYAVYNSDGTFPTYDNRKPFEIIVKQKVSNTWEDISTMKKKGTDSNLLTYEWIGVNGVKVILSSDNVCLCEPVDTYRDDQTRNGLYCKISKDNNIIGQIYIPISFYLNRYGLDYLNDWDGNSITLNDNGGAVLSPVVGAGKKENNKFTGILMGEVKQGQSDQIGLFGYHNGQRSIFLDSKTGKAEFGKNNQARISLDPSKVTESGAPAALLYSEGFASTIDKSNTYNLKVNNLPDTIESGLLIDLTTPQIGFGNGNFYVTSEGHIHAAKGGDIAGWYLSEDKIYKEATGMRSTTTPEVIDSQGNQFKVPTPSGDIAKSRAFYAGTNESPYNFYVTHDGYLRAQMATIGGGDGQANCIFIGVNSNKSAIFTLGKKSKDAAADGFYIGIDGIGIGKPNYDAKHSKFQVDSNGVVWMTQGHIGKQDTLNPNNDHQIHLVNNTIYTGKKSFWQDYDPENRQTIPQNGIYLSQDGIALGQTIVIKNSQNEVTGYTYPFLVTNTGHLTAKSGLIGSWHINQDSISSGSGKSGIILDSDGSIHANYVQDRTGWSISSTGTAVFNSITANIGGEIGGWIINGKSLKASGIIISSTGGLSGTSGSKSWSITTGGVATFTDLNVTGKDSKWNNGSINGGSINTGAGGVTATGSGSGAGTFNGYVDNRSDDRIKEQLGIDSHNAKNSIYVKDCFASGAIQAGADKGFYLSGNISGKTTDGYVWTTDDLGLKFQGGILTATSSSPSSGSSLKDKVQSIIDSYVDKGFITDLLGNKTYADYNHDHDDDYVSTSTYNSHKHSFSASVSNNSVSGTTGAPN